MYVNGVCLYVHMWMYVCMYVRIPICMFDHTANQDPRKSLFTATEKVFFRPCNFGWWLTQLSLPFPSIFIIFINNQNKIDEWSGLIQRIVYLIIHYWTKYVFYKIKTIREVQVFAHLLGVWDGPDVLSIRIRYVFSLKCQYPIRQENQYYLKCVICMLFISF